MATGTIEFKDSADRMFIKGISSSSSAVLTFTGNVRMLLVFSSTDAARQGLWLVLGRSGSSPIISQINSGSSLSYTAGTGTLTLKSSSSTASQCYALIFNVPDGKNNFTVA